ncbi:MAG: zinc metallopeptidase [Bacteroidales bacterium]|nr:zinc metallopeptidase [Bacteroidales bacterium]
MFDNTLFYWIIFGLLMLLSFIVSRALQSYFNKCSKIFTNDGLTGREVAEKMLYDNGIYDVKVVSTGGLLTDHYNPADKTINLSYEVYNGNSVTAAAVAAHETGHAVQHAHSYVWLSLRSKMVPVVNIASRWVQWILLAGMLLVTIFPYLLLVGIALFGLTTLFSFITLPVEINASRRALVWMNSSNITTPQTHPNAEKCLRLAAYTYVIAALSSLATLLYYILIYSRRS